MSSEILLKLQNVHKNFGGVKAVNGVDFEVHSNRITGLIGPNGAGKSTIFNLITGFSEIDDGFIYFLDDDISNSSPKKTVDIGIVRTFQIPGELKTMSVWVRLCICLVIFISYLTFTYGILYVFNIDQKLLNMVPSCLAFTATLLMWKAMK